MSVTEGERKILETMSQISNNYVNQLLGAINAPLDLVRKTEQVVVITDASDGATNVVIGSVFKEDEFVSLKTTMNNSKARAIALCDSLKAYLSSVPDLPV